MMYNYNDYDIQAWKETVKQSGCAVPKAATGVLYNGAAPFQIFVTEADVEVDGRTLRGCLVEKCVYDADDTEAVNYTDELSVDVWEI